jgi:hypothetical protein
VLTILDLFSRVGLPEYPEAAVHIFTSFSELVAMGCELDWEATITKLFDEGRHSAAYCIASPEEGEKPPKPKAKAKNKPKKTKNLKVRIADAHKGMNKPHPKPIALPPPPPKRDFCCRPPAPGPLVQPGLPKTGQHKSEDLSKSKSKSHTRTVSHCVDNLSDLVNNLSTSHHKASPTPKKGRAPPAVNLIQQSLTDRILWSISIGFPPNLPKACEEIARQALGEILDQHTSADGTHKPCSKLISGDHSSNDSECEPGESGIRCIGEAFFKILADRDADFNNKAARAKIISGMVGFEDELD